MITRINWVDIYKGLAILLVVVGHTTGLFNPYIYQFHMAAFFFISGYTSRLNEKGLLQTFVAKGYSIYLPYVSFFLLTLFFLWLLHKTGFYPALFRAPYPGILFSLQEFVDHRIHINILGATWFLITLFGIYVVQRTVLLLCFNRAGLSYALVSLAIFLTGYGIIRASIFVPDGFWYLVFIGQFYFSLGYLSSQNGWLGYISTSMRSLLLLIGLNLLLFYLFAHKWPNTVDYPSRHFGNALGNFLAAANGIVFLFLVSSILDKSKFDRVVSYLIKIGRNTLGIVFLHFLFFKISYWLLAALRICDINCVSNFTPPPDIGLHYWWLISGLSIVLSVVTWSLFLRAPATRILMGQDKKVLTQFFNNWGNPLIRADAAIEAGLIQAKHLVRHALWLPIARHKEISIPLAIVMALVIWPLFTQGIICNDELQSSYWAQLGWASLWDHYLNVWASQGRSLGALVNISAVYVGFLSTNVLVFRAISIGLMLIVFGLFAWLIVRLMKWPSIGGAIFAALLLLLPISFEHTLPNAFVALFSLPLILAFLSFHLFLSYLENGRRSLLFFSALLWLFFLTGYEAFVILTPVFFIITYIVRAASHKHIWQIIVECRHIFAATVLFLCAYVIARHFFPSTYAGNSIADFNFGKSVAVVRQLVTSGIPGYYLFNAKYQYLFEIFGDSFQSMGTALKASPIAVLAAKFFPFESSTLTNYRNAFAEPRMLVIAILGLAIAWRVAPLINTGERMIAKAQLPKLLGIPVLMSILMAVPNSLGKLYQGTVNATNFVALPVTFMIYGFMVFSLVLLLWFILERTSPVWSRAVLMGVVVLLVLPVQAMNGIFAQEQERNFNRLTMLHGVFDTELLRPLDGASIFAPDFYQTKNLLAIHDGYWSNYAKSKGLNVDVTSKYSGQSYELRVLSDRQVVLLSPQRAELLSLEKIDNRNLYLISSATDVSDATSLGNGVQDGLFYKYITKLTTNSSITNVSELQTVLSQGDRQPQEDNRSGTIGNTIDKAQIKNGFFSDAWVASDASLAIKTGKEGIVRLSGLLTIPHQQDMAIEVFDNERKIGQYRVMQQRFQIVVPVNSGGQIAQLRFKANWEFDAARPDVRKLSYLLVSLTGE